MTLTREDLPSSEAGQGKWQRTRMGTATFLDVESYIQGRGVLERGLFQDEYMEVVTLVRDRGGSQRTK